MPAMAESASQNINVAASPERCFDVVTAFELYPEWAKDVKEAVVRERDDQGRATKVEFRASALGRSTHYTRAYDYGKAPEVLQWSMVEGDIMRAIDGVYRFTPAANGGTDVDYDLTIELVVPLPGFVKRRAEFRILNTIRELKTRAEA